MYPSRTFSSALLLAVTFQLVSSSPITPTLARRQDTVLAGFQLLGPDADCFDFSFKGNIFSATCVSVDAAPVSLSVNLDQCITNAIGNMGYLFKWVSNPPLDRGHSREREGRSKVEIHANTGQRRCLWLLFRLYLKKRYVGINLQLCNRCLQYVSNVYY
jgi:hypothetical protein